ncbi:MAG TPA: AIR synthase related protein [Candidatus Glassbacteria bacterium]|nr:AIR synthase related protein [Candidatus Glassbacteria bacterium]
MEEGKLSWELLKTIVTKKGSEAVGIIQGPKAGCDVAVFNFHEAKKTAQEFYNSDEEVLVVYKTDPITFPTPDPGRYAVIVNSNDIVTSGALPYAFNATIILPTESTIGTLMKIQDGMDKECRKNKITILGGHTEISSSVNTPIVSGAMIGFVPKDFYVPRKINVGDVMVCAGWCAKEGVGIIASEGYEKLAENINKRKLKALKLLGENISVINEALWINKKVKPGLMHDATEGGILGACYETIAVENFGLTLSSKEFPLTTETSELFNFLQIDPLKVISSGTLLVVTTEEKANLLIEESSQMTPIRIIGQIVDKNEGITLDGKPVDPPGADAIIEALRKIDEGSN